MGCGPCGSGSAPVTVTLQVRVTAGRQDVCKDGDDDAEVVVTVAKGDMGLDPTVAFMRGKLKATGTTGDLLAVLANGHVAAALNRIASRL
jgi:hypothetical protein